MMRSKAQHFLARVSEVAPVLSIVLVVAIPTWLPHDPATVIAMGPEAQRVAEAAENVPYRIGRWVGRDTPVPEAAQRMLRPNALLGRRYVDFDTNAAISFILVHCGDARDMLGHYPPNCYPNSGWVPQSTDVQTIELSINGVPVQASVYEFTRMQDWTTETSIRIFNFFVLGDGSTSHDIHGVSRRTSHLGASVHGVAQIQLVMQQSVPFDEAVSGSNEILAGVSNVFDALGVSADE